MLVGWPDVEIAAVTTTADPDGRRAGYAAYLLDLLGRPDIPVAAGAGRSLTTGHPMGELPAHRAYWGDASIDARPGRPEVAVDLLDRSIESGAVVVAIGPYTNLALLEHQQPGRLTGVPVVAMGGWVWPPASGLPPWGPERDWNVQCDTNAAQTLAAAADLTLVTLPAAASATLREVDTAAMAATGAVGRLLAQQSRQHGQRQRYRQLGAAYDGLPDDLVGFHWDPVACAVAAGWGGAVVEELPLRPVLDREVLRFAPDAAGRLTKVVTSVDGVAFSAVWLAAVAAADG